MLEIIKELCSKNAPSGCEKNVRETIISKLDENKTTFFQDNAGNLIVTHKGKTPANKIAFFAPMDEASIIITQITNDGFLKFSSVGIPNEALFSKVFELGENRVLGNCGGKTWHLCTDSERKSQPTTDNLIIDIGAKNKTQTENVIGLGDFGTFQFNFEEMNNDLISSKALSERMCCAALISILNSDISYEFSGAFTTCSKIGGQGCQVASNILNSDFSFILNACPAGDTPICPKEQIVSKINNGAVISVSDLRTIYDKNLVNTAISLAKENEISYQIKNKVLTVAEPKIVLSSGNGVKVCSLSIPMRYIDTPCCTASLNDFYSLISLCKKLTSKISSDFEL